MATLTTLIRHSTGRSKLKQLRQDKEIKGIRSGKEKLSLFAGDMTLYIENPEDLTKKLLEREIKTTVHLQLHQKNKIPRNKFFL